MVHRAEEEGYQVAGWRIAAEQEETRPAREVRTTSQTNIDSSFYTTISWNLNITNIAGEDRADPEPGCAAHGRPDPGAGVRPPQEDRQHHRDRGQGGGQHRVSPGGVE